MSLKGVRFTLLLKEEKVDVVRYASGALVLTCTTFMGVHQTLPTGESRILPVFGYAETVTRMEVSQTKGMTLH